MVHLSSRAPPLSLSLSLSHQVYLTGESYAGIYLPMLAKGIQDAEEAATWPGGELTGMAVGNGFYSCPLCSFAHCLSSLSLSLSLSLSHFVSVSFQIGCTGSRTGVCSEACNGLAYTLKQMLQYPYVNPDLR